MSAVTPEREKMGRELMEIKPLLMHISIHKYGLSPANADDLFQDVCVYMLDRGVKLYDSEQSYLPAIRWVHQRRALNHLRDNKRWDYDMFETLRERDHLSTRDRVEDLDAQLDAQAVQDHLAKISKTKYRGRFSEIMVKHFFDDGLNMKELGAAYGFNRHSLQGAKRRLRIEARRLYEA